jgi:hypothetical protein
MNVIEARLMARLIAERALGKLRVYTSYTVTYPQVRVLPDLSVPVKRRSVAVKIWRVSLAAMYTARPVIPEAFRKK